MAHAKRGVSRNGGGLFGVQQLFKAHTTIDRSAVDSCSKDDVIRVSYHR